MGITDVLKVWYKFFMVIRLLAVYEYQTFTEIDTSRKIQTRWCKGLAFGGRAHVLDVSEIWNKIWSLDDKYAKTTSIKNCWKNLLSWNIIILMLVLQKLMQIYLVLHQLKKNIRLNIYEWLSWIIGRCQDYVQWQLQCTQIFWRQWCCKEIWITG